MLRVGPCAPQVVRNAPCAAPDSTAPCQPGACGRGPLPLVAPHAAGGLAPGAVLPDLTVLLQQAGGQCARNPTCTKGLGHKVS